MGTFLDTTLVVIILVFLALIVWSRIMRQSMLETLREIKMIIDDWREVDG